MGRDFASTYWHVDCVRKMSMKRFYRPLWKTGANVEVQLQQVKAEETIWKSKGALFPVTS